MKTILVFAAGTTIGFVVGWLLCSLITNNPRDERP